MQRVLKPTGGSKDATMLSTEDATAIEDVALAYREVTGVDILDVTEGGGIAWDHCKKRCVSIPA